MAVRLTCGALKLHDQDGLGRMLIVRLDLLAHLAVVQLSAPGRPPILLRFTKVLIFECFLPSSDRNSADKN